MANLFDDNGAIFSLCKKYRYRLWRIWDPKKSTVLFIGLNPSVATEDENDRTINRCIRFVSSWGYGGFYIVNLFAFITSKPEIMKAQNDPIGPGNNDHIMQLYRSCDKTIFVWGVGGKHLNRDKEIISLIPNPYCLVRTQDGSPGHPLYLKKETVPTRFYRTLDPSGDGPECPHCGNKSLNDFDRFPDEHWECRECGDEFYW